MTLGGYDPFDDPHSYKGSNCLKNRLGLRDPDVLQAFELEMSSLRAAEPLPTGRFGPRARRHGAQPTRRASAFTQAPTSSG